MTRTWRTIAALAATVGSVICGAAPRAAGSGDVPAPNIVGGTEADPGEFPWFAGVLDHRSPDADRRDDWFCGGALIAAQVVLTAGHCVTPVPEPGDVDVLLGVHDLDLPASSGGERIQVSRIIRHPRFEADHDYALLILSTPSAATPLDLVGPGLGGYWDAGDAATVMGWGRVTAGGPTSPRLRKVTVPVVGDAECAADYAGVDVLDPVTTVCAGAAGLDSCQGDSGGPLVVRGPGGRWMGVGVVSRGEGCALPAFPGIYAEVNSVRAWIDEVVPSFAGFEPLTPARILDTRRGVPLSGTNTQMSLAVLGAGGVPPSNVTSVALNVTALGATDPTHVTVWPTGSTRPQVSNLNVVPGQTVANLVMSRVGYDGKVTITNRVGSLHVVVDVVGYTTDRWPAGGARFTALAPSRLFDTRDGDNAPAGPLGSGATMTVAVAGHDGVPTTGATAALIDVTAVGSTAESHLRVYPSGVPRPTASNVNFPPGRTVSNLVLAKLGADGAVTIYNSAGSTDVVGDVLGWFGTTDGGNGDDLYTSLEPRRVLDTRGTLGGSPGPVGAGEVITVPVAGMASVPAGAHAVVLNVTAVAPTTASHVVVFPAGEPPPAASNLDVVAGQTTANLVVVPLGAGGAVSLRNNSGEVYLVADLVGYTSG